MVKAMLFFFLILFCVVLLLSKSTLIVMQSKCIIYRANKTNWKNWIHWWCFVFFFPANKPCTQWFFTDWHLHLNSREKGVGFSLLLALLMIMCFIIIHQCKLCLLCIIFQRAAAATEVHFCCSSALLRPTRGVKKANFPEPSQTQQIKNWATRWETYFHFSQPLEYFIQHFVLQGVPAISQTC